MVGAMDLEELVAAYLAGQPWAGRELGPALRRLILPVFVGRFEAVDVEDLTQETIVAILRDISKFENRGKGSFKAWVWRIALNRKLAHAKKQARQSELEGDASATASVGPGPIEVTHWRERLIVVEEVFELVDPKFRSALEFLISGGDPVELAEELDLKPQTIRTRASRALMIIRELVRERWQTSAGFFSTPR